MKILLKTLTYGIALCTFMAALAQVYKDPGNVSTPPPEQSDYAKQAGDKLQNATTRQDYEDAADLLEQAVQQNPEDYASQETLGWVYLDKLHKPDKAYPHLAIVAKNRPEELNARKLFGMACTQTGRQWAAVREFEHASMLAPADMWIKAQLARAYAREGRFADANKICSDILATDPKNPDARLAQAEIEAWQGHSEQAQQELDSLLIENPTNVDALVLAGDVHRWNWQLTQAKEDYRKALELTDNNDKQASDGLRDANQQGSTQITAQGYEFKDIADFYRESGELDLRTRLSDHLYFLGQGDYWRFTNPGFTEVNRWDGLGGFEVDWARFLTTSVKGGIFQYQHRRADAGGEFDAKLSPTPHFDMYFVAQYQEPFVSSMPTVTNGLKQNLVANGLDIRVYGPISIQNSIQGATISDHNQWLEEKPQLSLHVLDVPSTYLRVQYDYLTYRRNNTNYWSPTHWDIIWPGLDTTIKLTRHFQLYAAGRVPYVFEVHKSGLQVEGALTIDLLDHLQLKGSYIYTQVPGDRSPWTGSGGQVALQGRF